MRSALLGAAGASCLSDRSVLAAAHTTAAPVTAILRRAGALGGCSLTGQRTGSGMGRKRSRCVRGRGTRPPDGGAEGGWGGEGAGGRGPGGPCCVSGVCSVGLHSCSPQLHLEFSSLQQKSACPLLRTPQVGSEETGSEEIQCRRPKAKQDLPVLGDPGGSAALTEQPEHAGRARRPQNSLYEAPGSCP